MMHSSVGISENVKEKQAKKTMMNDVQYDILNEKKL